MQKIIVTGGSGFIGTNLKSYLSQINAKFFFLDKIIPKDESHSNFEFIHCDLLNQSMVSKVLSEIKASHMIHMAWNVTPPYLNNYENFLWLKSSIHLLEEFHKNNGERILITGSCFEYDWDYGLCQEDMTPQKHTDLYSSSKNILRHFSNSFCHYNKMELVWARLFFLYGPYENPDRFIPFIIKALLENKKAVVKNGNIYRDYMFIADTVKQLSNLLFSSFTGTINIGTGVPTKLGDLALHIGDLIGRPDLLEIQYPMEYKHKVVYADINKLINEMRIKEDFEPKNGLIKTIDWWKKHLK